MRGSKKRMEGGCEVGQTGSEQWGRIRGGWGRREGEKGRGGWQREKKTRRDPVGGKGGRDGPGKETGGCSAHSAGGFPLLLWCE